MIFQIYCFRFDAVNPKNPPQHWQNPEVSISYRSQFEPDSTRSVLIIKANVQNVGQAQYDENI